MIVDILIWIGENIFGQPVILLGLVALIVLLLQKKPVDEVVTGIAKVMIGFTMMVTGTTFFVQELVNFQKLMYTALSIAPRYLPGHISLDKVIAGYGSYAVAIMTIAFIIHLLIARFTKLKFVYLTGHLMWWVSLTVTATLLTINPNISSVLLIGIGSIIMALYWSFQPAYIHKAMRDLMGSDEVAYGHTSSLVAWLAYKLGKHVGRPEEGTEAITLPKSLSFFKDYATNTAIILGLVMVISVIIGYTVNPSAVSQLAGSMNPVIWTLLSSVRFAVSIVVILTGVRMFIAEIMPAFREFAMKIVPGARLALDCPTVFSQAPTAVIIGFISGLIVFLMFMGIFIVTGFVVIVPSMITLFFPGGAAAVFGNRSGGWKGAILGGVINGLILAVGQAMTLPTLTYGSELAILADPDWYVIIWLLKGILGPILGR